MRRTFSQAGRLAAAIAKVGGRRHDHRGERMHRLHNMGLNPAKLAMFITRYRKITQEQLISQAFLAANLPAKGTDALSATDRTEPGNRLLCEAKDTLFALLFGDIETNVHFDRVERELLTLTVPRAKVHAFAFLNAATEVSCAGTWQDPSGEANDQRADNVILEVEYGEVREETIGDGIVTALRLINHLEVNEQILYGRMTNVEQSTLVD